MKCPNCRKQSSVAHLRENPECAKAVASICGQYRLSKRVAPPTKAGGRPKGSKNKKTATKTATRKEKIQ